MGALRSKQVRWVILTIGTLTVCGVSPQPDAVTVERRVAVPADTPDNAVVYFFGTTESAGHTR